MTKDIVEKILRQHELSIFNPEQMAIFDLPDDEFVTWKDAANEIERLRNKVQWLEMCENTVVKQDNEIEKLRKTNIMQARWLYEAQQENKLFKEKVRLWLNEGKPAAMGGE